MNYKNKQILKRAEEEQLKKILVPFESFSHQL